VFACRNPALGAFVFMMVYVVATVAFVPGSLLTLGAGFTFAAALGQGVGVAVATLVVVVGATVGSLSAFLIARYVLRGTVANWARQYRILGAIDRALERNGLRLMLLLRLSPLIPFSIFNYVAALTSVSFRDYALAHVGIIPGSAAYCYIGSALSNIRDTVNNQKVRSKNPAIDWTLLAVGVVATVAALVLLTIYARRELNQSIRAVSTGEPRVELRAALPGDTPPRLDEDEVEGRPVPGTTLGGEAGRMITGGT
jgi:uncharacterized membrane protein YdjX (TVP38/TMEM64 family)